MHEYIEAFNTFLAEHRPNYRCPNVDSLLKMLLCCYRQNNRMDSNEIRTYFDALYSDAEKVFPGSGESIVDSACLLCNAHQEQGFLEGVAVGLRLFSELHTRSSKS